MPDDRKRSRRPEPAGPDEDPNVKPVGYASPPCQMHELEPDYLGYWSREEVLALLQELLEAERAGAKVTAQLGKAADEAELAAALHDVRDDEARFCAMLSRHIEALGDAPSRRTGDFQAKVMALDGMEARLSLLNRGQGWVVRKLREALPRIADDALHAELKEMLETHERNIARCDELL